jgi:exodeoxyribonuclease VII large subunit
VARLAVRPEEGLEVICTGKITTYPARSNYQLVVEQMELAGQGALLKMLEDRRQKLAAEGLFESARKKPIPTLPAVIGVVTSPTGAVIRDIIHRLDDRFPSRVIVWPVPVQGEGAAEKIAAAISGFSTLPENGPVPRPDVLIVARGGGSLEDLMPFNEEIVVRAAATCSIPLISAVGHETDTTLIDFAADLRAPTPTAAAEMAVPERLALLETISVLSQRLTQTIRQALQQQRQILKTYAARLGDPRRLLELKAQHFDHLSERLGPALLKDVQQKHTKLVQISSRLPHPRQRLEQAAQSLAFQHQSLTRLSARLLEPASTRLEQAGKLLEVLSFRGVLKRGYAVVRGEDGSIVSQTAQARPGDQLQIEVSDGQIVTRVE